MGEKRLNTNKYCGPSGVRQLLQPAPQLLRQQPGPGGLPHQPHGRLQLPGGGVRGPRPRPDMTSTTLKGSAKFRETKYLEEIL